MPRHLQFDEAFFPELQPRPSTSTESSSGDAETGEGSKCCGKSFLKKRRQRSTIKCESVALVSNNFRADIVPAGGSIVNDNYGAIPKIQTTSFRRCRGTPPPTRSPSPLFAPPSTPEPSTPEELFEPLPTPPSISQELLDVMNILKDEKIHLKELSQIQTKCDTKNSRPFSFSGSSSLNTQDLDQKQEGQQKRVTFSLPDMTNHKAVQIADATAALNSPSLLSPKLVSALDKITLESLLQQRNFLEYQLLLKQFELKKKDWEKKSQEPAIIISQEAQTDEIILRGATALPAQTKKIT